MIEWITIQGSGTAILKWLAWARKQARLMADNGVTPSKHVRMGDGTNVSIEVRGGEAFIRVVGGKIGTYQFFGSLAHLYKTYRDPSYPSGTDRLLPIGYATLVTLNGTNPKALALVSSGEAPPDPATLSWPYDADPRNTDNYLRMTPAHQWDGLGVHQWYGPTEDVPKRNVPHLIDQWQQSQPCSALGWYGSGSASRFTKLDMAYDFGPTLFSSNPFVGSNKSPDSDWYGRAAWRTVDDLQWGSRSFVIMVDVNSVFYCYPTEGYGDTLLWVGWAGQKGNVPAELTQSQTCPWPTWVTVEALGVSAIEASVPDATHRGRLRPMWSFNHAGTRAACITAHRSTNWSDTYFASSYYDDFGDLDTTYQEDLPGMVEVEFSISITGPTLADFSFSVALRQDQYSGDMGVRTPVAVGYAVRPMGNVPLDSLILLEYAHYTDNPSMTSGPASPISGDWTEGVDPPLYDLKRPNKATVAVVSYQSNTSWFEIRRWLTYRACYPPLGDERKFYPRIEEFAIHLGKTGYANHFRFITNIVSMDLDSLSFCLGASARMLGDLLEGSDFKTYGAEAAVIVTIAFNAEKSRIEIGNSEIAPIVSALFDVLEMSNTSLERPISYPTRLDLASMTEIFASATLNYVHFDASAWETDPIILATRYATLTVYDGNSHSWTSLAQGASESMMAYGNIPNIPEFSGASHIYGPQVYTFWDGLPNVRPGMRWAIGGTLQAGTLSFADYPYGAIHHNSILFLTTTALNNIYHRFSTHRSGAWALFAGPFAARTDLSVWWTNGVPETAPPLAYEQAIFDRIEFVDERGGGFLATSHIDMLNSAYGKQLVPSDYFFELRYESSVGAEFRPASHDGAAHSWYTVTKLAPLGVIWSHQFFSANRWYDEFCFEPSFVVQSLHFGYDSFSTFPTPRMEGVFPPPRT